MKCLQGLEYEIPEAVRKWDVGDFDDFADCCNCGKCLVYIENGEVKFADRELIYRQMYDTANAILTAQFERKR